MCLSSAFTFFFGASLFHGEYIQRTSRIALLKNPCSFVVKHCHDAAHHEPLLASEEPSRSSMRIFLKIKRLALHCSFPEKKKAGSLERACPWLELLCVWIRRASARRSAPKHLRPQRPYRDEAKRTSD